MISARYPSGRLASSATVVLMYAKDAKAKITSIVRRLLVKPKANCCIYKRHVNGAITIRTRNLETAYLPPSVAERFESEWYAAKSPRAKDRVVNRYFANRPKPPEDLG
jgi:hypothetical protein